MKENVLHNSYLNFQTHGLTSSQKQLP